MDLAAEVTQKIESAIPDASVQIEVNGNHIMLKVIAATFENLNRLNRQKTVYAAIQELMAGTHAPLHAVDQLITQTPAEAAQ